MPARSGGTERVMNVETRDFGPIEIEPQDVISFVQPIYGFDQYQRFVFLYDQHNSHIVWLQSVEEKNICFILVRPEVVRRRYEPDSLPAESRDLLGEGELTFWLVTVVASQFADSTVNLKSPIVVNAAAGRAVQVILEEDLPIRHPLVSGRKGRE